MNQDDLRLKDLKRLMPRHCKTALEIGARDGYLSHQLAHYFETLTALDLHLPNIKHERIVPVKGDVTALEFSDNTFDVSICTEVLEHIPKHKLQNAAKELMRVTRHNILIGVPYKQDTRVGRTTCASCGNINPPWGHVNVFDKNDLVQLFRGMRVAEVSYIGLSKEKTNFLSTKLMDIAGNPWGTYEQDETCVHCGGVLAAPTVRSVSSRIYAKMAVTLSSMQKAWVRPQPKWIHVLFEK